MEAFSQAIYLSDKVYGINIAETDNNRKAFLAKVDKDKSLTVNFAELASFFIDIQKQKGSIENFEIVSNNTVIKYNLISSNGITSGK